MREVLLNNGNKMPEIMLGSFQLNDMQLMERIVFEAAKRNCFAYDTSPSYRTEDDLAKAIHSYTEEKHEKREKFFLQSKIDSWQMIAKKGDIRPYVMNCLSRTGLEYWDLLLIHWPQPEYFAKTWLCFEELYKEGVVKNIGVCNFKIRHFEALKKAGASITPMVVQNEIHPFHTDDEVLHYCKENDITVQAYSPLCRMLDIVTDNPVLNAIAEKNSRSIAQIILRWHIQRNTVPIVKTGNPKRLDENLGVFDFSLTQDEMSEITNLNEDFKIFLESRCCPGY